MASSGKAAPADPPSAARPGGRGSTPPAPRLAARLAPLPLAGASLCVGYSGGLDSTVLLHLLADLRAELGFHLSAVHVHHGLHPRADAWQAHCEAVCAGLGVPLRVARARVEPDGRGPEAAARAARYAVFAGLDVDYLALAHQRDDQAETLLLNLLRGAGVRGLAAMPLARSLSRPLARGRPVLLRPLLDASRAELLDYARTRGLAWVEDDSNLDPGYTRNFIRHRLLPLLETRQPAIRPVLARTAGHLAEAAGLLDDLARLDLGEDDGRHGPDPTLALARLNRLARPRAANLLRYHLHRLGLAPLSTAALDELLDQLLGAAPDAGILWHPGGPDGPALRVWRGRLHVDPGAAPPPEERVWRGEEGLDWGGGRICFVPSRGEGLSRARVDQALARDAVAARPRRGGEALRLHPARPRRCLKKLWQEAGVPPWERSRLPLLWLGETLAWVAGLGVDADLQARRDEPGWLISWHPPAPPPP